MDIIRTIPKKATEKKIFQDIMGAGAAFFLVDLMPRHTNLGDYFYLCWNGGLVGRAPITCIEERSEPMPTEGGVVGPGSTMWVGGWERPLHRHPCKGFRRITYLRRRGTKLVSRYSEPFDPGKF